METAEISEIIFENADENRDTTFEVHQNIHDEEGKTTPNPFEEEDDMFTQRRERPSLTITAKESKMFKGVIGPKGGTLAAKTNYHPQESIDYLTTLQMSINNKNMMFNHMDLEGTPNLTNSIKKGRKYYQDDGESVLMISGAKSKFKAAKLDLDVLDYSAAKNLQDDYNKKSIRGIRLSEAEGLPEMEEGKYSIGEGSLKEAFETGNITMYGDTSELFDMNVPQTNDPKVNELGNYNSKYKNVFEEFYIIGVDSLTLMSINTDKVVLRPSLLKHYPDRPEHKTRHDVIKDFCFPTGIPVEQVDLSSFAQEQKLNEILFNQSVTVENCFLFTINANDYEKGIIYQDEYLHCLAVITNEIMSTDHNSTEMSGIEDDKLYIVQKAY